MTPFDDFVYLINHVLLGEEPEPGQHRQFTCKIIQNHIKAFDAATSTDNDNDNGTAATATNCGSNSNSNNNSGNNSGNNVAAANGNIANGSNGNNLSNNSNNSQYNGSYSKNGTVAMHNYYVKNGHHCCT
ncbi:putative uncharacterized protein DDB_G0283223 isoform X2 [Drosophila innubila]|uniref:putative uncharacterized protein DDB_G0283223 isoform X2 n=1 Tax=Drosophila innubila TaxID=198719 RepID=UPI00148E3965|nr:putative uncharacterized protein DDB_G0283223 isoform X2 [Drosophila innubila]